MREQINYELVKSQRTRSEAMNTFKKEAERVGYISLTDALLNLSGGGTFALKYLDAQHQIDINKVDGEARTWKIRVLKDVYGNKVKPGDVIVHSVQNKPVNSAGRMLRISALNDMIRRGTYDKDYVDRREFIVDDDNCIKCFFSDAFYFLYEFGVNEDNGQPLTGRPEFSKKAKGAKQKHYWRFHEVHPVIADEKQPPLPSVESN